VYNTNMLKTFKYRIYPTRKQTTLLLGHLEECRWLYNQLLEERKAAWETEQKSLSYYDQAVSIPKLKEQRPALGHTHSQVLQNVAVRIDLSFVAFFRRVKAGEKPGYPRFKGKCRYNSITFPQMPSGCYIKDKRLYVSKVGHIKIVLHRQLKGEAKTAIISRSATGKWYVCFSSEVEAKRLASNKEAVGIDVGLHSFATLSNGDGIEPPKFFRQEEKALAKVQRRLSKAKKGTYRRRRRRKVVARVHERIAFRRENFAHIHSRKIVNAFGIIAVEDLEVNRMTHNHCLAKSICDAAWSMFFGLLLYKAAEAGRVFIRVNPAYTSQDCSQCGHRQKMPLVKRVYRCPCCHLKLDRDLNAAKNILRLGLQSLGIKPIEAPEFIRGE
jgi:putative transposase